MVSDKKNFCVTGELKREEMGVISGLILTGSACCRVCIFYEKQYVIVFMFLINEKRTRHGVVKSLN